MYKIAGRTNERNLSMLKPGPLKHVLGWGSVQRGISLMARNPVELMTAGWQGRG